MTREEQKQYNAENYPASILSWLNEATDRAYDEIKSRTCDNCKYFDDEYCNLTENDIPFSVSDYVKCNKWEKK